jgi:hypothetical protein
MATTTKPLRRVIPYYTYLDIPDTLRESVIRLTPIEAARALREHAGVAPPDMRAQLTALALRVALDLERTRSPVDHTRSVGEHVTYDDAMCLHAYEPAAHKLTMAQLASIANYSIQSRIPAKLAYNVWRRNARALTGERRGA